MVPLTILRDTRANQMFLLSSLVLFSTDFLVVLTLRAPMHTAFLRPPLVSGLAKVVVCDRFNCNYILLI